MTCSDAGLEQAGKGRKLRRDSDSHTDLPRFWEWNVSEILPDSSLVRTFLRLRSVHGFKIWLFLVRWKKRILPMTFSSHKISSHKNSSHKRARRRKTAGTVGGIFESTPSLPLSRRCFPVVPCFVKCSLRKPNLKKKKITLWSHVHAIISIITFRGTAQSKNPERMKMRVGRWRDEEKNRCAHEI